MVGETALTGVLTAFVFLHQISNLALKHLLI